MSFPGGASGKEPVCQCRRHKRFSSDPWVGKIPWRKEGMATHSSFLAWRIPWTEDPGGLESIVLHRVGHHWSDLSCTRDSSPPVKPQIRFEYWELLNRWRQYLFFSCLYSFFFCLSFLPYFFLKSFCFKFPQYQEGSDRERCWLKNS